MIALSPKGSQLSSSEGVHLTVFSFYYVFQEGYWVFGKEIRVSEIFEMFYCVDVWVGGWVGGWLGGDILPHSIFLIFKNVNKQNGNCSKNEHKSCIRLLDKKL